MLLVVRPDASSRWGGDTALAYDTRSTLATLGVMADLVETDEPATRGYDLAHVFNIGAPEITQRQVDACTRQGTPVALSPVWLDLRELEGRGRRYEQLFVRERSPRVVDAALRRWANRDVEYFLNARQRRALQRHRERQQAVAQCARVLLPNSAIEARDCLLHLNAHRCPLVVVPIPASLAPAAFWQSSRHGLVVVGRVETRKNQTALLYALRNDTLPIDILGAAYDPGLQSAAGRWCQRARFHGSVERSELLTVLGRAAVHALVSWCETAGVATMEAALAGAQIVVSDRGAEVEYFGADAEYANPADPESIRAAVLRAEARTPRAPGDRLDRRLRSWTWNQAGLATVRAYRIALGEVPGADDFLSQPSAG